jgi:hypothetical protein
VSERQIADSNESRRSPTGSHCEGKFAPTIDGPLAIIAGFGGRRIDVRDRVLRLPRIGPFLCAWFRDSQTSTTGVRGRYRGVGILSEVRGQHG